MDEKIFRIRMYSGRAGGSNYYHHADVIETHYTKALKAAREGRVTNWRWIDTFDKSNENYRQFEYLYMLDSSKARSPMRPLEKIVT